MRTDESQHLVDDLKAGEEGAWREFMNSYGRLIFSAGRRLGLGSTDLDELFQVTCVEAYKSIKNLREPSKLPSWTYSIAYRSAIKILRGRGRTVSSDSAEGGSLFDRIQSGEPSPEDIVVQFDQAGLVSVALEKVGPPCGPLIRLLYLEVPSPSYEQISRRLRMPIGSIGPTRARCLQKLKKVLENVSGGGGSGTNRQDPDGGTR